MIGRVPCWVWSSRSHRHLPLNDVHNHNHRPRRRRPRQACLPRPSRTEFRHQYLYRKTEHRLYAKCLAAHAFCRSCSQTLPILVAINRVLHNFRSWGHISLLIYLHPIALSCRNFQPSDSTTQARVYFCCPRSSTIENFWDPSLPSGRLFPFLYLSGRGLSPRGFQGNVGSRRQLPCSGLTFASRSTA